MCVLTDNINTAKSLIRANYIKRVKHNLYAVCNIEFKSVIANQYMIASKIKDDSYISGENTKVLIKNIDKYLLLK